MTHRGSIQQRLALTVGLAVTLLWLAAAAITAHHLSGEMEVVYDEGLRATAQRILPIARHDLRESGDRGDIYDHEDDHHESSDEEDDLDERDAREVRYGDEVSFVVRDREGRVLLSSKGADPSIFPAYTGQGFVTTSTHQVYLDTKPDGNLTIAVAEPLAHRSALLRQMLLGLVLPLFAVIPLSLLAIAFVVRGSLRPVHDLRAELTRRGAQDLSPLPDGNVPRELMPISAGINQLLEKLKAAFLAERSFAANTAHELRTPVAGAIAQAQRIRAETHEPQTSQRASEIEATLKRLMRMSEKLMQLARAEGGRLQADQSSDVRPILRLIAEDFIRTGETRLKLVLPEKPVLSRLDPDAIGILFRNMVENALNHGSKAENVVGCLEEDGTISVSNAGPVLSTDLIDRLSQRFERGQTSTTGSGLGLSIIKTISDRTGMKAEIVSPRFGCTDGVEVRVKLPTE